MDGYLEKPIRVQQLLECLDRHARLAPADPVATGAGVPPAPVAAPNADSPGPAAAAA
jgi:hypothetical protein